MRKIFFDSFVYLLTQVLLKIKGLIILPLFAHKLGPDSYGLFTQIIITTSLLSPVLSLKLETAIIRFLSAEENKELIREKFSTSLFLIVLTCSATSLIIISYSSFASKIIFGDAIYSSLIWSGSGILATSCLFSYLLNFFRIKHRVNYFSMMTLFETLSEVVLMFVVVYSGGSIKSVLLAVFFSQLIFVLIMLVVVGINFGGYKINLKCLKELLDFSVPLIPNGLSRWGVNYADRVCIAQLLSISAVASYTASYSFGMLINFLIMPISFVIFPHLVRKWEDGRQDEVQQYFSYLIRCFLFIAFPICISIALLSEPILHVLVTSEFQVDKDLVFWICLGFVFNGLYQINVYCFHLVKKTRYMTWILLASLGLNLALNFLLIPSIGIIGAAIATTITFFVMFLTGFPIGRKLIGYEMDLLGILKIFFAAYVMYVFVFFIPANGLLSAIANWIFSGLLYLAILTILKFFSKKELKFIFNQLMEFKDG